MKQRHILVVDDQEDLRRVFELSLSLAGYKVSTASNGLEASRMLSQEVFDLVLTDLFMPGRDGIELVSELQKMKSAPPVVVMSGGGMTGGGRLVATEYLRMARHLGAVSILEKPFSDEQLLSSIALALPDPVS